MKRSRTGESLTGGTGDVNPQWMKFTCTQSGTDTTTTATQPLPVVRAREGVTPTVVEVLKVQFFPIGMAEVDSELYIALGTKNLGTTGASRIEPSLIAAADIFVRLTTSGQYAWTGPATIDLTDHAGHGMLVATDNIYLQLSSGSTGASNAVSVWILYRFKRIGTLEYVGIVQSQQ
jgi:hypothetical protein